MNGFSAFEIDTILEGLERVARTADTPDEKAAADSIYAKVVYQVISKGRGY